MELEWGFWWQGLDTHKTKGHKVQRGSLPWEPGPCLRTTWMALGKTLSLAGQGPLL